MISNWRQCGERKEKKRNARWPEMHVDRRKYVTGIVRSKSRTGGEGNILNCKKRMKRMIKEGIRKMDGNFGRKLIEMYEENKSVSESKNGKRNRRGRKNIK